MAKLCTEMIRSTALSYDHPFDDPGIVPNVPTLDGTQINISQYCDGL